MRWRGGKKRTAFGRDGMIGAIFRFVDYWHWGGGQQRWQWHGHNVFGWKNRTGLGSYIHICCSHNGGTGAATATDENGFACLQKPVFLHYKWMFDLFLLLFELNTIGDIMVSITTRGNLFYWVFYEGVFSLGLYLKLINNGEHCFFFLSFVFSFVYALSLQNGYETGKSNWFLFAFSLAGDWMIRTQIKKAWFILLANSSEKCLMSKDINSKYIANPSVLTRTVILISFINWST